MYGHYHLDTVVSDGLSGVFCRALDTEREQLVAIRKAPPAVRNDPAAVARLRAAVGVLARAPHPHLADVREVVEEAERTWIVEEWIEGTTLASVVGATGRLTPEQSIGVLRGTLRGHAHVHEHALAHGAVQPGHIVLRDTGHASLVAF